MKIDEEILLLVPSPFFKIQEKKYYNMNKNRFATPTDTRKIF